MRKMIEKEIKEERLFIRRDFKNQVKRDGLKSFTKRSDDRRSFRNPDYDAKLNFSYSLSSSDSEDESKSDEGKYLTKVEVEKETKTESIEH